MSRTKTMLYLLVSIALFVLSLMLPAFSSISSGTSAGMGHWLGGEAFIGGMLEAVVSFFLMLVHPSSFGQAIPMMSWFANPLLGLAWIGIAASKPSLARVTSVLGILFCALFLTARTIETGSEPLQAIRTGIGYWVWFGSILLALVVSFATKEAGPEHKPRPERERWNPY
jgi:hypothetical protein